MALGMAFSAAWEAQQARPLDGKLLLQCALRGADLTHRKSPEWMLNLARAYRINGILAEARSTSSQGLMLLPGNPAIRLHKLLTDEAHLSAGK